MFDDTHISANGNVKVSSHFASADHPGHMFPHGSFSAECGGGATCAAQHCPSPSRRCPGMAMPSTATAQTDFPDQSRFQKVLLNDRPGEPMSATAPQCDLMPLAADLVLGARFASGGCGPSSSWTSRPAAAEPTATTMTQKNAEMIAFAARGTDVTDDERTGHPARRRRSPMPDTAQPLGGCRVQQEAGGNWPSTVRVSPIGGER